MKKCHFYPIPKYELHQLDMSPQRLIVMGQWLAQDVVDSQCQMTVGAAPVAAMITSVIFVGTRFGLSGLIDK